ncbi:MAG: hypothetical protein PW792_10580 [Acidobacteriaceae bacterium]|nr:hypothetical protein [Acidobacteriaceae bacterium]
MKSVISSGDFTAQQQADHQKIEASVTRLLEEEDRHDSIYANGDRLLRIAMEMDLAREFYLATLRHNLDTVSELDQKNASACHQIVKTSRQAGHFVGWRLLSSGYCLNIEQNADARAASTAMQEYVIRQIDLVAAKVSADEAADRLRSSH